MVEEPTYMVPLRVEFAYPNPDPSLTVITGWPQEFMVRKACLAVYNNKDSGLKVKVRSVLITPLISQASTRLPTNILIQRVTSQPTVNGITRVAGQVKMDSNQADTELEAYVYPTITTGTTIRKDLMLPNSMFNTALYCLGMGGHGRANLSCLDTAVVASPGYNDTTVQGIVLKASQGLAILYEGVPFSTAYAIDITYRTYDEDQETFIISEIINNYGQADAGVISLWNPSNTGTEYEIVSIAVSEMGEQTLPYFSVERIDGVEVNDNPEAITVVPADSNNDSLSGDVLCLKDPIVMVAGHKTGGIVSGPYIRKNMGPVIGQALATLFPNMTSKWNKAVDYIRTADEPLVLDEGQGLAIMKRNASQVGIWDMLVMFTIEETGGASSPVTHSYGGMG